MLDLIYHVLPGLPSNVQPVKGDLLSMMKRLCREGSVEG
jgi:hypothetical protein